MSTERPTTPNPEEAADGIGTFQDDNALEND